MQISAFDLDHTLVGTNSSLLFYRYLIRRGIYPLFSLLRTSLYSIRHYFFDLSLSALHERVFERFLKGFPLSIVQEEVKRFLQNDFYRFLYYPTFSRLRSAQHQGHRTVILSNGPSFLVGPIAHYLDVDEWSSSVYSTDNKGFFRSVDSVLLGEGKASYIQNLAKRFQTDLQKVTAYSDSIHDLPFLSIAGKAVVVNPDGRMRKISQEKLWEVI